MEAVSLVVRDNGIYPVNADKDQRIRELRARSVLAYGFENKLIQPVIVNVDTKSRFVLLSVKNEPFNANEDVNDLRAELNTGRMYIGDQFSGLTEQPGRLIVYVDSNIDIMQALTNYFQASVLWLKDNASKAKAIQSVYDGR